MGELSKFKKISVLLAVPVLLSFIGHYFLFKDLINKNENNTRMLDQIQSESGREVYVSTIKKQLQTLDPEIKKVGKTIVGSNDVISFIEELESIARNNGLSIKNNSISEEVDAKLSSTTVFLKIRSETNGPWSGTYKFLSELESLPYKVRVNSFSMSSGQTTDASGLPSVSGSWLSTFEIKVLKYK